MIPPPTMPLSFVPPPIAPPAMMPPSMPLINGRKIIDYLQYDIPYSIELGTNLN